MQNDFDDISFYTSVEVELCAFETIAKDLTVADSEEDTFDDISWYIGEDEEGCCASDSVCDSDISQTDSEYDSDDDDDNWSFDSQCLDDSDDASFYIGGEERQSTFSPRECLSSPTVTSESPECLSNAPITSELITFPSRVLFTSEPSFYCMKSACHQDSSGDLPSLASSAGSECSSSSDIRSQHISESSPQATANENKDISDFCAEAAKVGGALLLLTLWGTRHVPQTRSRISQRERTIC